MQTENDRTATYRSLLQINAKTQEEVLGCIRGKNPKNYVGIKKTISFFFRYFAVEKKCIYNYRSNWCEKFT